MTKIYRLLVVLLAIGLLSLTSSAFADANNPIKVIFDTDMGNDVDDAMALAMVHTLQDRGECELLAVTMTKDNRSADAFVKMVNEFYGRPRVPIGFTKSGVTPAAGRYVQAIFDLKDAHGHSRFDFPDITADGTHYTDAVTLLRQTLANQNDGDVVIVQIGFSTNLAALLETPGDEFSPLSGRELMAKKVRYLSIMAGAFTPELAKHKEYNIKEDLKAAQKLFTESPVPIVCNGYEIGMTIPMPGKFMARDYNYVVNHPIKESYSLYRGLDKDQATYDLASVLYAVRPDQWYFDISSKGTIKVNDDATTTFTPNEEGNHRILSVNEIQKARIIEAFIWLCSAVPLVE